MDHLLIAGGSGFIGYHVAKKFKKKGWKITSVSISKPKRTRTVKGVKYILLDLTKKKDISEKLEDNYDYVINVSGYTSNIHSKKFKGKIFNSHFYGAKNLIDFFKNKKIKLFVQIGSSAEYGNASGLLKESHNCKPVNNYGIAKLRATKYVIKNSKKKNLKASVLRLFQVYGPKQGQNRAVMQILKFCINNKRFPASDGKQIRDFCYVSDVANAIDLTFKRKITGKIINIGYGKGVSMKELINKIKEIAKGGKPEFGLFKNRNHENPILVPSISLAKKVLKWKPKINLEKGLIFTKKSLYE